MSGAKLNFVFLVGGSMCVLVCTYAYMLVLQRQWQIMLDSALYAKPLFFAAYVVDEIMCHKKRPNYGIWSIFIETKMIFSFEVNFELILNLVVVQSKNRTKQ